MSVDPVLDPSDPQQSNAYAYANHSPVSYSDPSGEKSCSDSICGIGARMIKSAIAKIIMTLNIFNTTTTTTQTQSAQADVNDAKEILLDELGITDALDCFTTGDLASCAATAVTVIASMIGGVGAILIAKYGMRLNKLAKLIERVKKLGEKLVDAVGKWIDNSKTLKKLLGSCNREPRC